MLLKDDRIAKVVLQSLHTGEELGHYTLQAYVIMANHVHVLLTPLIAPSRLLRSPKGVTAREANKILGRIGQPFWQHESYDHWVRDTEEFERIRQYIENNPVKAGLTVEASAYRWSSASRDGTIAVAATKSGRATGF